MHHTRVWDLPTRLFHWALVFCLLGLYLSANLGGNWMNWHLRLGYTMLTLLLFRLLWGVFGGHWSRFSSFLFAPADLWAYLRDRAKPEHHVGHNPLGALSVFALLTLLLLQVGTGLISDDDIAFFGPLVSFVSAETVNQATAYHKRVGKVLLLVLVALHLLAIAYHHVVKKERLLQAMISGDKRLPEPAAASRDTLRTRLAALALLGLCALAVYALVGLAGPSAF
ncbi:cytochrome b/b6 domain-containing protein [Hydrogenophaga sp.]|uniref:cytochrome b/b6 domain-containing protein n=1 Tax=Hydrogenophaga sp. TaxID=1904254 RepID=UPI0019C7E7A4|nr:cytochrome b/b6 domain-containing protein [Hydrogenophaga sp.]MBD3892734.1 cytochrome B [Hydrogenophaga sp.]